MMLCFGIPSRSFSLVLYLGNEKFAATVSTGIHLHVKPCHISVKSCLLARICQKPAQYASHVCIRKADVVIM